MVPCASLVFEELHTLLRVCIRFFRSETALQLLEVVIHNGEIKALSGWQAMRMLGGRVGHSTSSNNANLFSLGCPYLLDWSTGLDYWTGLLDSRNFMQKR